VDTIAKSSYRPDRIVWEPNADYFYFFKRRLASKLDYTPSIYVIIYTDNRKNDLEIKDEEDFMIVVKTQVASSNYRLYFKTQLRQIY